MLESRLNNLEKPSCSTVIETIPNFINEEKLANCLANSFKSIIKNFGDTNSFSIKSTSAEENLNKLNENNSFSIKSTSAEDNLNKIIENNTISLDPQMEEPNNVDNFDVSESIMYLFYCF